MGTPSGRGRRMAGTGGGGDASSTVAAQVAAGSRIQLAIRQVGASVELHVTDQGPGMPADQRQRAFDRFWRGPPTERDGSELGLAIVRQLLEASGGTAELRPNPGGGLLGFRGHWSTKSRATTRSAA